MSNIISFDALTKEVKQPTVTVEDLSWLLHFIKKNKRVHFRETKRIMSIEKRFIKQLNHITVPDEDVEYLLDVAETFPDKAKA